MSEEEVHAAELEGWDSEMDNLVRWFNAWTCPQAPFSIDRALKVVDRDLFLAEMHDHIDRCGDRKEQIPSLRLRLKSLKAWVTEDDEV